MSDKRQPTLTQEKELTGVIVEFQASEPIQCKQQTESRLPIKMTKKNTIACKYARFQSILEKKKRSKRGIDSLHLQMCATTHVSTPGDG